MKCTPEYGLKSVIGLGRLNVDNNFHFSALKYLPIDSK